MNEEFCTYVVKKIWKALRGEVILAGKWVLPVVSD